MAAADLRAVVAKAADVRLVAEMADQATAADLAAAVSEDAAIRAAVEDEADHPSDENTASCNAGRIF